MLQAFYQLNRQKPQEHQIMDIEIEKIVPNPAQPRKSFTKEYIDELAGSIRSHGLLQPITVRQVKNGYELIAGERRLRACRQLGRLTIRAIVIEATDEESSVLALIENIMRQDLNFFEEAEGIRRLIETYGLTQEEVARKLCRTQSTIANKLRILRLGEPLRQNILEAHLTERHARALLRLPSDEERAKVAQYMIKNHLNVKQSEELIEKLLTTVKKKERERKKRFLFKDMRIFTNTINHALKVMQDAGIQAKAKKNETEDHIEYLIIIPKMEQRPSEPSPSPQNQTLSSAPGTPVAG